MELEQDTAFATALEECAARVDKGEEIEKCLYDYPEEYWEDLRHMVTLTRSLSTLGRDPTPEFQTKLEQQLLVAVDVARGSQQKGLLARFGKLLGSKMTLRVATAMIALLLLFGVSSIGVIQASADTLPDSPLYQVKTLREWVQRRLALSGDSRAAVLAAQASERARELDQAVGRGNARPIVVAISDRLEKVTERAVDQAIQAYGRGNPAPAIRTAVAIRTLQRRLDQLAQRASPGDREAIQQLQQFLEGQEQRLLQLRNQGGSRT